MTPEAVFTNYLPMPTVLYTSIAPSDFYSKALHVMLLARLATLTEAEIDAIHKVNCSPRYTPTGAQLN